MERRMKSKQGFHTRSKSLPGEPVEPVVQRQSAYDDHQTRKMEGGGDQDIWMNSFSSWKMKRIQATSMERDRKADRDEVEESQHKLKRKKSKTFREIVEEKQRREKLYGGSSEDSAPTDNGEITEILADLSSTNLDSDNEPELQKSLPVFEESAPPPRQNYREEREHRRNELKQRSNTLPSNYAKPESIVKRAPPPVKPKPRRWSMRNHRSDSMNARVPEPEVITMTQSSSRVYAAPPPSAPRRASPPPATYSAPMPAARTRESNSLDRPQGSDSVDRRRGSDSVDRPPVSDPVDRPLSFREKVQRAQETEREAKLTHQQAKEAARKPYKPKKSSIFDKIRAFDSGDAFKKVVEGAVEANRKPEIQAEVQEGDYEDLVIIMTQQARSYKGFGFTTSGGYDEKKPLVVSSVSSGSVADYSDLKVGDQLLSINKENTRRFHQDDVQQCLSQSILTGKLTCKVRRYADGKVPDNAVFQNTRPPPVESRPPPAKAWTAPSRGVVKDPPPTSTRTQPPPSSLRVQPPQKNWPPQPTQRVQRPLPTERDEPSPPSGERVYSPPTTDRLQTLTEVEPADDSDVDVLRPGPTKNALARARQMLDELEMDDESSSRSSGVTDRSPVSPLQSSNGPSFSQPDRSNDVNQKTEGPSVIDDVTPVCQGNGGFDASCFDSSKVETEDWAPNASMEVRVGTPFWTQGPLEHCYISSGLLMMGDSGGLQSSNMWGPPGIPPRDDHSGHCLSGEDVSSESGVVPIHSDGVALSPIYASESFRRGDPQCTRVLVPLGNSSGENNPEIVSSVEGSNAIDGLADGCSDGGLLEVEQGVMDTPGLPRISSEMGYLPHGSCEVEFADIDASLATTSEDGAMDLSDTLGPDEMSSEADLSEDMLLQIRFCDVGPDDEFPHARDPAEGVSRRGHLSGVDPSELILHEVGPSEDDLPPKCPSGVEVRPDGGRSYPDEAELPAQSDDSESGVATSTGEEEPANDEESDADDRSLSSEDEHRGHEPAFQPKAPTRDFISYHTPSSSIDEGSLRSQDSFPRGFRSIAAPRPRDQPNPHTLNGTAQIHASTSGPQGDIHRRRNDFFRELSTHSQEEKANEGKYGEPIISADRETTSESIPAPQPIKPSTAHRKPFNREEERQRLERWNEEQERRRQEKYQLEQQRLREDEERALVAAAADVQKKREQEERELEARRLERQRQQEELQQKRQRQLEEEEKRRKARLEKERLEREEAERERKEREAREEEARRRERALEEERRRKEKERAKEEAAERKRIEEQERLKREREQRERAAREVVRKEQEEYTRILKEREREREEQERIRLEEEEQKGLEEEEEKQRLELEKWRLESQEREKADREGERTRREEAQRQFQEEERERIRAEERERLRQEWEEERKRDLEQLHLQKEQLAREREQLNRQQGEERRRLQSEKERIKKERELEQRSPPVIEVPLSKMTNGEVMSAPRQSLSSGSSPRSVGQSSGSVGHSPRSGGQSSGSVAQSPRTVSPATQRTRENNKRNMIPERDRPPQNHSIMSHYKDPKIPQSQHWLVQEAERRRVAEQKGFDRQMPPDVVIPPHNGAPQKPPYSGYPRGFDPEVPTRIPAQRRQQPPPHSQEAPPNLTGVRRRMRGPEGEADRQRKMVNRRSLPDLSSGRENAVPSNQHRPAQQTTGGPAVGHAPSRGQHSIPGQGSAFQEPNKNVLPNQAVSGKMRCGGCGKPLGRGAAMIIESLGLHYHVDCFRCCVCSIQLGNGTKGTDVRIRASQLHCQNCYSNEAGFQFTEV